MATVELTIDEDTRHDAPADSSAVAPADADFVLAHVSDLHLSTLEGVSARALLDKRILGYLSWRHRRRGEHRSEVLDALRADLAGRRVDHIAVTGDLTHLGLPHEFRQAASWLERLGPPDRITVVPGNHDAYVREAWRDTFAQWSDYLRGDDAGGAEGDAVFPSLRLRGDIALIGLSTAGPTAPFFASGRLGERQLEALDRMLDSTGASGRFRIVLLHHPPGRDTVRWRKSLRDGEALRRVLARRGAELVLHGHAHFSAATWLDSSFASGLEGAHSRSLAIGVPSASAVSHRADRCAAYHLYRIRRAGAGWRLAVSVRAYSPAGGRFVADDGRRLRLALASAT
jgi:3',5'-cyclic AMP phosphodiesterase CpdA